MFTIILWLIFTTSTLKVKLLSPSLFRMESNLQLPTKNYIPAIDSRFPRVDTKIPIDISTERKYWEHRYPTNHHSDYHKDTYVEFSLESEPQTFIDFSSMVICVKLKLLKSDRSDLGVCGYW